MLQRFFNCLSRKLSLEEQIYLFNKHQVIIGCSGSALHGILFDIFGGKKMICLSDENRIDKSFLMIDAIKSLDSVYVGSLSQKESCVSDNWRIDRIINVDMTINALKKVVYCKQNQTILAGLFHASSSAPRN